MWLWSDEEPAEQNDFFQKACIADGRITSHIWATALTKWQRKGNRKES